MLLVATLAQRLGLECLGCFWHRCPIDGVTPRTNAEYWLPKLQRNVDRDHRNAAALADAGWGLIVAWEHEDPAVAADRIEAAVMSRRSASSSPGPCAGRR